MNKLTEWLKKKTEPLPAAKAVPSSNAVQHSPARPLGGSSQKTGQAKQYPNRNQHHPKPHHSPLRNQPQENSPTGKQSRFRTDKLLRIIPIGGLNEIGKNMNAIEYGNDIVTIDCGLQFPEPGMFGIDYVIPDITYVEERKKHVRGMLITHGHLDHIGALRHILPKLGFPVVYGSALTIGMIQKQLQEFKLDKQAHFKLIENGKPFRLGAFEVEFFAQNHSIPDSNGIVVRTPVGTVVHTGDYKFDFTPAWGESADFQNLARIGYQGVLALMGESTNATKPGHTISEKKVAATLEHLIEKAKGRIIISSFSSLLGRIGQILDIAVKNDRKVFISGRSMMNNIEIGINLGYIKPPKGVLRDIREMRSHPSHRCIILCTGSQGEGLSALNRVAMGEHKDIQLQPGDTIVFSSNPIIGNEEAVVTMTNNLLRLGAKVITNEQMDTHTSGHAKQEELKLMIKLMNPKFLIPVHGEYLHRVAHKELAMEIGMQENHVIIGENGDIIETDGHIMRKSKSKAPANNIFVDGSGVGEGHLSKVQLDRQVMAENGIVMIVFRVNQDTGKLLGTPGIDSRGFVYLQDSPEITRRCMEAAQKAYEKGHSAKESLDAIKLEIKRNVGREIMQMINRNPIIMPIMVKV